MSCLAAAVAAGRWAAGGGVVGWVAGFVGCAVVWQSRAVGRERGDSGGPPGWGPCPRVIGQLTTRGPPFDGRLDVSGLVWDRSAAKAAEWSASLVSERTISSQIDAYVGGDGGWASGEVDPDDDDYPSSGGSNGDDFGADDY